MKQIFLIISKCSECIYCKYVSTGFPRYLGDNDYGEHIICKHPMTKEFKEGENELYKHQIKKIAEWCPLEDYKN